MAAFIDPYLLELREAGQKSAKVIIHFHPLNREDFIWLYENFIFPYLARTNPAVYGQEFEMRQHFMKLLEERERSMAIQEELGVLLHEGHQLKMTMGIDLYGLELLAEFEFIRLIEFAE